MPDSQSSEPGFESPFATVSKNGHFRSRHWLICINEYLAIDSGGNVSDLMRAIQVLRNADGGGGVLDFPEKSVTKV